MGTLTDCINLRLSVAQLHDQRKIQLGVISGLCGGADVLSYAADMRKAAKLPASITQDDIIAINDQLSHPKSEHLVLLLETPGGSGEVVEDIVKLIRLKYKKFTVIVPGWAKSAGTILSMAADEIMMGPISALGPIDAQYNWDGRPFSAEALLEGVEEIKKKVLQEKGLNPAYVPILQKLHPGILNGAQISMDFAKMLVTDWLARYKFKNWTHHRTHNPGTEVTETQRKARAKEIADKLAKHSEWKSHGRSIKIDDLRSMGLEIVDYSLNEPLSTAVSTYQTLTHLTFEGDIYKLFETPSSQILKRDPNQSQRISVPSPGKVPGAMPQMVQADIPCNKCHSKTRVQANLGKAQPLLNGNVMFPKDGKLACRNCKNVIDISPMQKQIEAELQQVVVFDESQPIPGPTHEPNPH